MLKYQLKKGVTLSPGMAFRYKSNEELKALFDVLGFVFNKSVRNHSVDDSGLLIFKNQVKKGELPFFLSKFLTKNDQYLFKKKDYFYKTQYDDSPAGENKKVSTHHDNLSSTLEKQNDVNTDALLQEKKLAESKRQQNENYLFPQIDKTSGKQFHIAYVFKKFRGDGNIELSMNSVFDEEREKFESVYRFDDEGGFWILKNIKLDYSSKPGLVVSVANANEINAEGIGFRKGIYEKDSNSSIDDRYALGLLLALLKNKAINDKQYEFAAEIRGIEARRNRCNSTVLSKGIVNGNFKGDTLDHPNVKYGAQGFLDMLHNLKVIVIDGKLIEKQDQKYSEEKLASVKEKIKETLSSTEKLDDIISKAMENIGLK